MSMVRTQVYLESDQQKFLKKLARQEHVSMSGLIRSTMERYIKLLKIATDNKPRKQLSIIGIGDSGITDGSINHDNT